METHWHSCKEKVPGAAVSKKVMLKVFWNINGIINIDFYRKNSRENRATNCNTHTHTHTHTRTQKKKKKKKKKPAKMANKSEISIKVEMLKPKE